MYKTIVVQVDGGPGQASRLQAAALPANARDAHPTGAFGHSRCRERVPGGITRELPESTPLPLLPAH